MPLPTLSKSWTFSVNNAYTATGSFLETIKRFWFQIKASLKNPGNWTVIASSNAASVGAAIDYWASASSLNWGSLSGARSWIILQHPANGSQILIDLSQSYGGTGAVMSLLFSKQGWNVSGALSTSSLPSNNVSGDVIALINNDSSGLSGLDTNFVHHFMCSTDGYCHRHIAYVNDTPMFGLFLETPSEPVAGWSSSGLSSYAMLFTQNSSPIAQAITTNSFTSSIIRTRIGTTVNISAYLSGECYGANNTTVLPQNLQFASVFDNSYLLAAPGIFSTTAPYRGKLGKVIDLWFGVNNFLGGRTYPDDGTRQFASHGALVTPWNGSVMRTR